MHRVSATTCRHDNTRRKVVQNQKDWVESNGWPPHSLTDEVARAGSDGAQVGVQRGPLRRVLATNLVPAANNDGSVGSSTKPTLHAARTLAVSKSARTVQCSPITRRRTTSARHAPRGRQRDNGLVEGHEELAHADGVEAEEPVHRAHFRVVLVLFEEGPTHALHI